MKRKATQSDAKKRLRSYPHYLAQKLRELCDEKGNEIDPEKSAGILNKMGLHFKDKSSDKLNLLWSAALLNSAVARKKDDQKFKKDLLSLCTHVLEIANAENPKENLVGFSEKTIYKMVKDMRDQTKERLKHITDISEDFSQSIALKLKQKKVFEIKDLNNMVYKRYLEIMHCISKKCEYIMGKPPCKYTVVGMGSLARREITPYSDFESIIVLEEVQTQKSKVYKAMKSYFRWYSLIFQIILINLKETVLRFLEIPFLNDINTLGGDWFYDRFTKCGISPDGLSRKASKNPLGQMKKNKEKSLSFELIQPVSEMVRYIQREEDEKHGYHLADILTKTCFVSGDPEVYNTFIQSIKKTMQKTDSFKDDYFMSQVVDDMDNFDPFKHLELFQTLSTCNIKCALYRSTTLYISALGRYHSVGVEDPSCFEIIDKLCTKKRIISKRTAGKLSYVVALACYLRLQIYMNEGEQADHIGQDGCYDSVDDTISNKLSSLIGENNVVEYFTVACRLQNAIRTGYNDKNLDQYFQGINVALKFRIIAQLNFHSYFFKEWEKFRQSTRFNHLFPDDEVDLKLSVAQIYQQLGRFKQCLKILQDLSSITESDFELRLTVLVELCFCWYDMKKYKQITKIIDKQVDDIRSNMKNYCFYINDLSNLCNVYASSKLAQELYEESLQWYRAELKFLKREISTLGDMKNPSSVVINSYIACCHNYIVFCLVKLDRPSEGIPHAHTALSIQTTFKLSIESMCRSYELLGTCYAEKENYKMSLKYFKLEVELRRKYTPPHLKEKDKALKLAECNFADLKEACNYIKSP